MSASEDLLRTPLHAEQPRLGGRTIAFAGCEMPVQYADGVLAEHRWTGSAALRAVAVAAKSGAAERFKGAPYQAPRLRLDENLAARSPRLVRRPEP